jgi:F0F1-type ATP synthase membrane subunit c/vacuolar-type H+-ATPase subunit K
LKPSYTTYACADTVSGQLDQGVFAILSKTENDDHKGLSQQVDNRILQSLPEGANSALAISAVKTLKHVFMQGAVATIHGSKLEDFEVDNDNLWIYNKKDVTWGNFTLEGGQVLSPVIKAKNFQLGLVGQTIQMQIIDATAKWPDWKGPGEIDLHMNITQHFEFELKQKTNGDYVLVPKSEKDHTSVKEIVTSVAVSKGVTIFEICLGIGLAIIGAVVGGAIGGAFDATTIAVAESGEQAVITITEETIEEATAEVSEEVLQQAEKDAALVAEDSLKAVDDPGFFSKFKSAITANKWKLFGGAVGGFVTFPTGMVADFMTLIAEGKLEDIPPFNEFAATCTGATTFPGSTGWDLKSAGLNGPLVISGDLKSADN